MFDYILTYRFLHEQTYLQQSFGPCDMLDRSSSLYGLHLQTETKATSEKLQETRKPFSSVGETYAQAWGQISCDLRQHICSSAGNNLVQAWVKYVFNPVRTICLSVCVTHIFRRGQNICSNVGNHVFKRGRQVISSWGEAYV